MNIFYEVQCLHYLWIWPVNIYFFPSVHVYNIREDWVSGWNLFLVLSFGFNAWINLVISIQKEAVYGLTEVLREEIKNARLVANPGCYPTSVQLPVVPLIKVRVFTLQCTMHILNKWVFLSRKDCLIKMQIIV